MFILGNLFIATATILNIILQLIIFLISAYVIMSWLIVFGIVNSFHPVVHFLQRITEPLLEPIRRFLPPYGIDFSPFIAILVIIFLQTFIVNSLFQLGYMFR
jgi:YggT family protein